jgi:hypothetical protein
MGGGEQLTPDECYDTTGTIDELTLEQLEQLEAQAAVEDAEELLGSQVADHG